jgi:hypothetical protein
MDATTATGARRSRTVPTAEFALEFGHTVFETLSIALCSGQKADVVVHDGRSLAYQLSCAYSSTSIVLATLVH